MLISCSEVQGMVTYIPVGGGASEMAVGGKLNPNRMESSCNIEILLHDTALKGL